MTKNKKIFEPWNRAILGPVKTAKSTRMNNELRQDIKKDRVKKIKEQGARWLGHV